MNSTMTETLIFYVWWLFINGCIYYSEYRFLLSFASPNSLAYDKRFLLLYIVINCLITILAIRIQTFDVFFAFIHTIFLCLFSLVFLKNKWTETIVPAVIIFTLSTFMSGITTILMRFFVVTISNKIFGNVLQAAVSFLQVMLFYFTLRLITKKYVITTRQTFSSCLYILLLPCGFMVWGIHYGLKLENQVNSAVSLWAIVCLTGTFVIFFVILHVFGKITLLSHQVTEQALTEQYRSFQHDINNHMMILSGLMKEEKYSEADRYLNKVYKASVFLKSHVSTGKPALDILLNEKINWAEGKHIPINQTITLPPDISIDDMDLCTIISNAFDNSARACLDEPENERQISISIKARYQFLLIEFTNPYHAVTPLKPGIGLKNIKRTAEKYQGSMEVVHENGMFRLSVLLCNTL